MGNFNKNFLANLATELLTHSVPLYKFQDIKEFLEDADQGVMLLALGFLFDPGQVPKERMDNLMEALGSMPQKVIARFPVSLPY